VHIVGFTIEIIVLHIYINSMSVMCSLLFIFSKIYFAYFNACYMLHLDLTSIYLPTLIFGEEYKLRFPSPVAIYMGL